MYTIILISVYMYHISFNQWIAEKLEKVLLTPKGEYVMWRPNPPSSTIILLLLLICKRFFGNFLLGAAALKLEAENYGGDLAVAKTVRAFVLEISCVLPLLNVGCSTKNKMGESEVRVPPWRVLLCLLFLCTTNRNIVCKHIILYAHFRSPFNALFLYNFTRCVCVANVGVCILLVSGGSFLCKSNPVYCVAYRVSTSSTKTQSWCTWNSMKYRWTESQPLTSRRWSNI